MEKQIKDAVQLKLDKAYREACIAASLKGQSGAEPRLSQLEYELKTLPLQKVHLFVAEFIKAALKD